MSKTPTKVPQQTVKIVEAGGEPAVDALVAVVSGTAPYPEMARVTGKTGTVRLSLPDGDFEVEARSADDRIGRVGIAVRGGASSPATIVLPAR